MGDRLFHAEKRFVPEIGEEKAFVVDSERRLSLRSIARATPERDFNTYLLTWVTGQVPVEGYCREHQDPLSGETFFLLTLGGIGQNTMAHFREGIVANFGDPRVPGEQLKLWAIEALLAYGSAGQGLGRHDGHTRAILDGVEMRLSDFGPYRLPQNIEGGAGSSRMCICQLRA